jgi:hypothetical protein
VHQILIDITRFKWNYFYLDFVQLYWLCCFYVLFVYSVFFVEGKKTIRITHTWHPVPTMEDKYCGMIFFNLSIKHDWSKQVKKDETELYREHLGEMKSRPRYKVLPTDLKRRDSFVWWGIERGAMLKLSTHTHTHTNTHMHLYTCMHTHAETESNNVVLIHLHMVIKLMVW